MLKTIKKITLGSLLILLVSVASWLILLFNPSLLYAEKTEYGQITIHHANPLDPAYVEVMDEAISLIKASELYDKDLKIDLSLFQEGLTYTDLVAWYAGKANGYALLNKVGISAKVDFSKNHAFWQWEVNDMELRYWGLSEIIAHELTHTLQNHWDSRFPLKYPWWKIEGYAEYISRKNRYELKKEISRLLSEKNKEHKGLPWVVFEDGTGAPFSYFEATLKIQYLMEVKHLSYLDILSNELSEASVYKEMLKWYEEQFTDDKNS